MQNLKFCSWPSQKNCFGMEVIMKKKIVVVWMSAVLCALMLVGCGTGKNEDLVEEIETVNEENKLSAADDTAGNTETETDTERREPSASESDKEENAGASQETQGAPGGTIRIGSLKGPTSMGLVYLMEQARRGGTVNSYEFIMTAAADELLPAMLSGELDIALIPANLASVLYNRAEGDVSVIDINTLGVLYAVSGDETIEEIKDLKGKTVYMTGKGTTPDYVMQYLLKENGLAAADLTLEYKSEATEVAAMLTEVPEAVGVLPQPFVTAACAQNEKLSVVLDLTKQWAAVQGEGGSSLVTGVTVVRNGFLTEEPEAVDTFLEEHAASAAYANEHVEETAQLVAEAGIIDKAAVAAKALPECNITYIDGEDMKTALSGYLEVLWEQDPAAVGGGLPGDGFYYVK